ncbi:MAG: YhbY family RNA-binding protein [Candidatus Heimdallarchaeota archaeon]
MKDESGKELDQKLKSALRKSAAIQVGKKGITPSLIQEIANQLEMKDVIKIKVLKPLENPEIILQELATSCNAVIWKQIGRTGILTSK